MTDTAPSTRITSGFAVSLGGGRELQACRPAGHDKPYLGIRQGSTFVALAEFISVDDMEFLHEVLRGVAIFPLADTEHHHGE